MCRLNELEGADLCLLAPSGAGGTETSTGQVQSLPAGISPGSETKATVVGHLPAVRSDLSAVTVGSKAYVLGGEEGEGATARSWRFDPATGKVSATAPLPQPIAGGAVADFGRSAYLVGGTGAGGYWLWRYPSKAHPAPPGGIYEFTREGKILWSYRPESGDGRLNHPSLAERLPNGDIAVNDDYRHRVVIVDPKTKKIVWQYGITGHPGTGPDHLHTPDGFDPLEAGGKIPTHPFTG